MRPLFALARLGVRLIDWLLVIPLYVARVRILRLSDPGRIGHFASEIDLFVKGRVLGLRPWCIAILPLLEPPANECLARYWGKHVVIVRSPFWARFLTRFDRFTLLTCDVSVAAMNATAPYFGVLRAWGQRPPILALTEEDRRRGPAILAALGIPEGAEYVCFHPREAGYSPEDDDIQRYRNAKVESYFDALTELTARGIWCIRMGDPTSSPVPPMPKVIDYAHSSTRSDEADVFLCATCKFFLGSSSGLLFLANVFGRPSASAHHAPMSSVLAFGINDVAIPKLVWAERLSRYLTFPEVFDSEVAKFRFTRLFEERQLRVIENSGGDIRAVVLEMLERMEGHARYTAEDEELQRRFVGLFRPGHYGHGGVNRVGRDFLRKYAHLL